MVHPDPSERPTASELLAVIFPSTQKSKVRYQECMIEEGGCILLQCGNWTGTTLHWKVRRYFQHQNPQGWIWLMLKVVGGWVGKIRRREGRRGDQNCSFYERTWALATRLPNYCAYSKIRGYVTCLLMLLRCSNLVLSLPGPAVQRTEWREI